MALKLINQYSVAGEIIPDTYNNQADYLLKIPNLANDCIVYISTHALPQIGTYVFDKKAQSGKDAKYSSYSMPDAFYRSYGSSIPYVIGKGQVPTDKYIWTGSKTLLLHPSVEGQIKIDYYRYPHLFSTEFTPTTEKTVKETVTEGGTETVIEKTITVPWSYKDGTVEADLPLEAQYAIPYYVGAHLISQDYMNESYILMNEFELKMSRLSTYPTVDVESAEDVYGTGGDFYFGGGMSI